MPGFSVIQSLMSPVILVIVCSVSAHQARSANSSLSPLGVAAQAACFHSRWTWLSLSFEFQELRQQRTTLYGPFVTETYLLEDNIGHGITTVVPCDGMTRVHDFSSTGRRNFTLTRTLIPTTVVEPKDVVYTFTDMPEPKCVVEPKVCLHMMRSASTSFYLDTSIPRSQPGDVFFLGPDRARQPCDVPESENPSACTMSADQVMLLYWPQKNEERDVCSNGWYGADPKFSSSITSGPPWVVSMSEIIFTSMNTGSDPGDDPMYTTMKGQWNFTSPSVYIAFNTLTAGRGAERVGRAYSSKVIAVPPHLVSSIVPIFPEYHNGSGRALAEAFMTGGPFEFGKAVWVTRPYNYANLGGLVPVAAWLQGNIWLCKEQPDVCRTVTAETYNPTIYLPPEAFTTLDPAWSECLAPAGFHDPVLALPTAPSLAIETPIPQNHVFGALAVAASPKVGLPQPTPSSTKYSGTATSVFHSPSPINAAPFNEDRPFRDTVPSVPLEVLNKDQVQPAVELPFPVEHRPSVVQTEASAGAAVTLLAIPSPKDEAGLGSSRIKPGASAVTVRGRIVPLVSNVVNGKTVNLGSSVVNIGGQVVSVASNGVGTREDNDTVAVTATNDRGNDENNDELKDSKDGKARLDVQEVSEIHAGHKPVRSVYEVLANGESRAKKGVGNSPQIELELLIAVVIAGQLGLSWL